MSDLYKKEDPIHEDTFVSDSYTVKALRDEGIYLIDEDIEKIMYLEEQYDRLDELGISDPKKYGAEKVKFLAAIDKISKYANTLEIEMQFPKLNSFDIREELFKIFIKYADAQPEDRREYIIDTGIQIARQITKFTKDIKQKNQAYYDRKSQNKELDEQLYNLHFKDIHSL